MPKKALLVLTPFMLIFLLGFLLLLRPHYRVTVTEVTDTFTRQEKTGQRSAHQHTVSYAVVKVEFNGAEQTVTVHDHTWDPLKSGDSVVVTRGLSGRLVEYRTDDARSLMLFSGIMGPVCMLITWVVSKRRSSADGRTDA